MWGTITAPDGSKWKVKRRWLPWRPRTGVPDGVSVPDIGDVDGILGAILLVIVAIVLLPLLVLLALFLAEWTLLLVLLPVVMFIRAAFGLPWTIHVSGTMPGKKPLHYYGKVKGWTASTDLMDGLRQEIRQYGRPLSLGAPGAPDPD
jgi:hypothetical protein